MSDTTDSQMSSEELIFWKMYSLTKGQIDPNLKDQFVKLISQYGEGLQQRAAHLAAIGSKPYSQAE